MRDTYYEESAVCAKSQSEAKRYAIIHWMSVVCFAFAGIAAYFVFMTIPGIIAEAKGFAMFIQIVAMLLPFVLCLGLGLALFFFKKRYNQSYDYVLVEDELRVTRVYNGRKRKHLRTFMMEHVMKIGYCDRDSFEDTLRGVQSKAGYLTPNREPMEGKEFFYFLYSDSVEKRVYIIEARPEMLNKLVLAAGRQKFESR